jgi:hypothetical protein
MWTVDRDCWTVEIISAFGGCKFKVWMKPLVARTPEARTGLSCVKARSRFFRNLEFQSSEFRRS